MKKILFSIIIVSSAILGSCESKEKKEEATEARADSIVATKDTTAYGVPSEDTTSTYEKQHYGNGSTKTSGNSGH